MFTTIKKEDLENPTIDYLIEALLGTREGIDDSEWSEKELEKLHKIIAECDNCGYWDIYSELCITRFYGSLCETCIDDMEEEWD